jgi:GMP reductase
MNFSGRFLCIDVANGYMEQFVNRVREIRNKYPEVILIAGNVVTPEMVQTLILAGADIVKIGIGSGAVCTTRLIAGVGYPQLSAVIESADAAHGLGGHIISDGGCVYPADIGKAFAAGADFVMVGSLLAGHTENWFDGKHYGMSSKTANEALGGLGTYKASEGREVVLQHKGPLENTLQIITGGLRSTCSYVGAHRLKDLPKCSKFIRVNSTHNRALEGKDV